ncbi:MAG: hypothetical protein Q7K42_00185 [Candidatus Diapherotrites archaeon]|nr:hypothetical protein [Candidatus Diapherotrites archaeon]
MKFANFFLPIVLIAVFLFAGCLKPNYQKSCQDLNGFACSQGFICRAGYYETTDASECCAEQCIDPNSPEILTQKAFTGQLNEKC